MAAGTHQEQYIMQLDGDGEAPKLPPRHHHFDPANEPRPYTDWHKPDERFGTEGDIFQHHTATPHSHAQISLLQPFKITSQKAL